jgi:septal ring factor EnvC (AmiA/AmiB activator)
MPANVPPSFVGTLPGWITAITVVGGLFWAFLRFGVTWRGQSLDADEQIRKLFAEEIAAVRAERKADKESFATVERHLRDMVEASDRRHEECENDRRALRRELDRMHDEIRGMRNQILAQATDRVLLLEENCPKPSETAPHAHAAAKRIKNGDHGGGK